MAAYMRIFHARILLRVNFIVFVDLLRILTSIIKFAVAEKYVNFRVSQGYSCRLTRFLDFAIRATFTARRSRRWNNWATVIWPFIDILPDREQLKAFPIVVVRFLEYQDIRMGTIDSCCLCLISFVNESINIWHD